MDTITEAMGVDSLTTFEASIEQGKQEKVARSPVLCKYSSLLKGVRECRESMAYKGKKIGE